MARSRRSNKPKTEQGPWPPPTGYERFASEELESEYARLFAGYVERMGYFAELPPVEQMADGERTEYYHDYMLHIAEGARLGDVATERGRRIVRKAHAEFAAIGYDAARGAYEELNRDKPQYPRMEDGETLKEYLLRREAWWDAEQRAHGAWRGMCDAYRAEWESYLAERGCSR